MYIRQNRPSITHIPDHVERTHVDIIGYNHVFKDPRKSKIYCDPSLFKDCQFEYEYLKNDKSFIYTFFKCGEHTNEAMFSHLSLKTSKLMHIIPYMSKQLKHDDDLMTRAILEWSPSLEYASDLLKYDQIKMIKFISADVNVLKFAPCELLNDDVFMLAAMRVNWSI